ncbi:Uncharacterised protein [Streptococcus pneumoniae]|nr:Uncharacterised protein [Streptococcus pneumoniae]
MRCRARAGSAASSASWAARETSTIEASPWVRVSWISRASRSRSALTPARCSVRASSACAARSCSATARWRSDSACRARYAPESTTATAAPTSGPMTAGTRTPPAPAAIPATTTTAIATTSAGPTTWRTQACRATRSTTCRTTKKRGKATHAKSPWWATSRPHSSSTRASQATAGPRPTSSPRAHRRRSSTVPAR